MDYIHIPLESGITVALPNVKGLRDALIAGEFQQAFQSLDERAEQVRAQIHRDAELKRKQFVADFLKQAPRFRQCKDCGKRYSSRRWLTRHRRYTHEGTHS